MRVGDIVRVLRERYVAPASLLASYPDFYTRGWLIIEEVGNDVWRLDGLHSERLFLGRHLQRQFAQGDRVRILDVPLTFTRSLLRREQITEAHPDAFVRLWTVNHIAPEGLWTENDNYRVYLDGLDVWINAQGLLLQEDSGIDEFDIETPYLSFQEKRSLRKGDIVKINWSHSTSLIDYNIDPDGLYGNMHNYVVLEAQPTRWEGRTVNHCRVRGKSSDWWILEKDLILEGGTQTEPMTEETKKKAVAIKDITIAHIEGLKDIEVYQLYWEKLRNTIANRYFKASNDLRYTSVHYSEVFKKHIRELFKGKDDSIDKSGPHAVDYADCKKHIINYLKEKDNLEKMLSTLQRVFELKVSMENFLYKSYIATLDMRRQIYTKRMQFLLFDIGDFSKELADLTKVTDEHIIEVERTKELLHEDTPDLDSLAKCKSILEKGKVELDKVTKIVEAAYKLDISFLNSKEHRESLMKTLSKMRGQLTKKDRVLSDIVLDYLTQGTNIKDAYKLAKNIIHRLKYIEKKTKPETIEL